MTPVYAHILCHGATWFCAVTKVGWRNFLYEVLYAPDLLKLIAISVSY